MRRLPSPAEPDVSSCSDVRIYVTCYISGSLARDIRGLARSRPVQVVSCLLLSILKSPLRARVRVCVCVDPVGRKIHFPLGEEKPMEGCLYEGA